MNFVVIFEGRQRRLRETIFQLLTIFGTLPILTAMLLYHSLGSGHDEVELVYDGAVLCIGHQYSRLDIAKPSF